MQRLRLASGLVLFVFVLAHLLNHALGIVSLAWMDAVEDVRTALWRSLPGTVLLYGALLVHATLAIIRVARRRTVRMPVWEAVQIVLGLLIPFLLVQHAVGTRGLNEVFGFDDTYRTVLGVLWPGNAVTQTLLLLLVWVHGCIGLHFWLRLKPFYAQWAPWLLAVAVAVPLLSSWGWIEAARRLALSDAPPGMPSAQMGAWANGTIYAFRTGYIMLMAAVLVAFPLLAGARLRGRGLKITYPNGQVVRAMPGPTLLEVSRMGGIPHAAVCGGRARCSTCRVRIAASDEDIAPPGPTEARVLARIDAPADVRLACQVRPTSNMVVQPLLPMEALSGEQDPIGASYRWGREQSVAVLFVDMRGFTTLSEGRYPYDVVYLLNEYLSAMSAAVTANGGYVDKFIGDAVMAIFGIGTSAEKGARAALAASGDMVRALEQLNRSFGSQLPSSIRIGVGIHTGPAVLGRIGVAGAHQQFGLTALGDTVNVASRLEDATKELATTLVVSADTITAAGVAVSEARTAKIVVRGRHQPFEVFAIDDPTVFSFDRTPVGRVARRFRFRKPASL
ncbi:adenylate/guanylate cyclase domain-containing protein [Amorphus sp. 3PC139-8]|uniref:adenylate/guanylate cyclase domain-containing protein n=1 Tax=Amorphus sp. 3PC139-8 TaxID=2735676 RepID=UPI00345DA70E